MEHNRLTQLSRRDSTTVEVLPRPGDTRWATSAALPREHALVVPWPEGLLGQFSLRMAGHGMSISSTQMQGNPGYALQQLAHARAIGDETLALLAGQLFRFYESHQSGLANPPH